MIHFYPENNLGVWPKVVIVVLNWNGKKNTLECLGSLKRLDYPKYEIIVVDNASTDGSQISVKEAFPDVTLIESKENIGFGPGLNAGLKKAKLWNRSMFSA